jgi:hypothetical protein
LIRNLFLRIIGVLLAGVVIQAGLLTLPFTTGLKLSDENDRVVRRSNPVHHHARVIAL